MIRPQPMRCPHCERPVQPGDTRGRRGHIAGDPRILARYRCPCGYLWFLGADGYPAWEGPDRQCMGSSWFPDPVPAELAARVDLCRQARELYPRYVLNAEAEPVHVPGNTWTLEEFKSGRRLHQADPRPGAHLGRLAVDRPVHLPLAPGSAG
jgi:hypothetical protein